MNDPTKPAVQHQHGQKHAFIGKWTSVASLSLSQVQTQALISYHSDSDVHMQHLDLGDYIIGILMGNINPPRAHIQIYKMADQDLQ